MALPSRRLADGTFRDLVHPITAEARELLQKLVMEKFAVLSEPEPSAPAQATGESNDSVEAVTADPVTAAASSPTGVSGTLATNTQVTVAQPEEPVFVAPADPTERGC